MAGEAEVGGDERLRRGGEVGFVSSSSSPASMRSSSSRDIVRDGPGGINEQVDGVAGYSEEEGGGGARRGMSEGERVGERRKRLPIIITKSAQRYM